MTKHEQGLREYAQRIEAGEIETHRIIPLPGEKSCRACSAVFIPQQPDDGFCSFSCCERFEALVEKLHEIADAQNTHTPGPWEIENCGKYINIWPTSIPLEKRHNPYYPIARVTPLNAGLVVAAPQLLALVEKCLKTLIADRDALYDSYTLADGVYLDPDDEQEVMSYDKDIE